MGCGMKGEGVAKQVENEYTCGGYQATRHTLTGPFPVTTVTGLLGVPGDMALPWTF